jgi:hypothetical protein
MSRLSHRWFRWRKGILLPGTPLQAFTDFYGGSS